MSVELPDSYQAIYQRAIQQMGVGESEAAIDSLLRIVRRLSRLSPETLKRKDHLQRTLYGAWNAVTQFLSWENRFQAAIDLTSDVMDRLPEPLTGSIRIASLTVESGQVEEGLAALTEIAREQDNYTTWSALGTEYKILGRHAEAEEAYRTALRHAASNEEAVVANLALFDTYRTADQVEKALDAWQMALVLEPDMADEEYRVYGWLIRSGHVQQAAPYLEREPVSLRRTFFEGLIDGQAGRQDAARRKWQEVFDSEEVPEEDVDVEIRMEAALRLDLPLAADELAQALFLSGDLISARAEVLRGIAKLMLDQPDLAETHIRQALLRLRRGSRVQTSLVADLWELLTQLVPDPAQTAALKHYFDTKG
jgi:tetratricopeptide (TPR) repeat protein